MNIANIYISNFGLDMKSTFSQIFLDEKKVDMALNGSESVHHLERKFSKLTGVPHALAACNATMSLWAIFEAWNIHNSDIIVPPYTWGGSISGLILAGNRPVFADIDPDTLCLDPDKVKQAITPKTEAILCIDIYGFPSFGEKMRTIADRHDLYFIQDCAQSFGAYDGKLHTGYWADAAVFSLTYGKPLFAGEGGIIVTRHQELYEKLVWLTQHPNRQKRDLPFKPSNEFFYNLRMNPLSAVWASENFDKVVQLVQKHRMECEMILEQLWQENLIISPRIDISQIKPSFYSFTIWPIKNEKTIIKSLKHRWDIEFCTPGISKLLYEQEAFVQISQQRDWNIDPYCPIAEKQVKHRKEIKYTLN